MQERRAGSLQKRSDLMPWNATNADVLRQALLKNLSKELVALHNAKSHLALLAFKSGIPGCPTFVTNQADLSWQWGSSPMLRPPAPAPKDGRVELEPVQ